MSLWIVAIFCGAGLFIGYVLPQGSKFYSINDRVTQMGLVLLLLAMGAQIGMDEKIISQLNHIGFHAFLLALSSIVGSVIFLYLLTPLIRLEKKEVDLNIEPDTEDENSSFNLFIILIMISVIIGIFSGLYLFPSNLYKYFDIITIYGAGLVLFGVAVDIGRRKEIVEQIKIFGWRVLLIPLAVGLGSILGTVIIGMFINLGVNESSAIGAGFGWYSLSGVLLANIYSVKLGSLAFLTNVFREILAILSVPLVAKYIGKITSIAPGGASTMDVNLPVVKEAAGNVVVIPAFISGVILTALVPILVPLLVNLG